MEGRGIQDHKRQRHMDRTMIPTKTNWLVKGQDPTPRNRIMRLQAMCRIMIKAQAKVGPWSSIQTYSLFILYVYIYIHTCVYVYMHIHVPLIQNIKKQPAIRYFIVYRNI